MLPRKRKIDHDKSNTSTTGNNKNNNSFVGPTKIKRNKLDNLKPTNKPIKNDYEKSSTKDNLKPTNKPIKNEKSSTKDKLKLVANTKRNNISTTSSTSSIIILNNKSSSSSKRQHNNSILSTLSTKIEKRTVLSTTENSTTVSAHASDGKKQNKSFIPSKLVSNSKIKREVVKQQNANQASPSEILKKVKSKLNKKVVELLSKGDEFQGEKVSLKKITFIITIIMFNVVIITIVV